MHGYDTYIGQNIPPTLWDRPPRDITALEHNSVSQTLLNNVTLEQISFRQNHKLTKQQTDKILKNQTSD